MSHILVPPREKVGSLGHELACYFWTSSYYIRQNAGSRIFGPDAKKFEQGSRAPPNLRRERGAGQSDADLLVEKLRRCSDRRSHRWHGCGTAKPVFRLRRQANALPARPPDICRAKRRRRGEGALYATGSSRRDRRFPEARRGSC